MKFKIHRILLPIAFLLSVIRPAAADDRKTAQENDLIRAVELFNADRTNEAQTLIEGIIAADPEADAAHYYLALCKLKQRNAEAAETELRTAARLDTANFWYRYRLAMLYSMTGKEELTLAMFEDLIRDFPKKYDLYYNMVELYTDSGEDEKALETMDQIEAVFGKNEMTAMSRFELMRKMGRTEEAYAGLEEYNKEFSSPQILTALADWKLSTYEAQTAIELYDEALELAPGYAPALLGKAEAHLRTQNYDEYFVLVGDFLRDENLSVIGKCGYLDAVVNSYGSNFLRIFQPQMDSLMTLCEEIYPADTTVNYTTGRYYYATGRGELAKERFRANSKNYPSSLAAAANYTELLMYLSQWDSLTVEAREAYRRFPQERAFLELAGIGEYHLENYDKVIDIYSEMLAAAPRDSAVALQCYQTIGDMHHQLGDSGKAYKAYEKALKVNPDYAPVLNNYAYFLCLDNKKLKKACAMSRKTVELQPDNSTYLDTYGWILHVMGRDQEAKPVLKNAIMLYGGKDNPEILDHYAEVLFSLKEYDLAFLYWNQAKAKNDGEIPDLEERIALRRSQMNRK